MLQTKPTEHLTGITIQGDYNDFYDLVESIYSMVGSEQIQGDETLYYGVKNRLLGVCYDIRHAFMGDRDLVLEDNGMNQEIMKWHAQITPTQNVYYSVNILFPEAIFVAASVPQIYPFSSLYYGVRGKRAEMGIAMPYADYVRDKANLDVLCAGIWQALGTVVGDEELEKIIRLQQRIDDDYMHYATQYIDKCNVELLKTQVSKRKDKLRNIAKRIVKKTQAYYNLKDDLEYWAQEYGTSIYDLEDPRIQYPQDIEW